MSELFASVGMIRKFVGKSGVLILVVGILFAGPVCVSAGDAGTTKIYLMRGLGGLVPSLDDPVRQLYESKGLEVVPYKFTRKSQASQEIARAYRAGELKGGVILVGYSLGACSVIRVSRSLEKEGIPVKSLFLVESANPLQTVPANVEACFNFYHFPALVGKAIKADSEETFLVNCEAYRDAGFGMEYTHFVIPFFERVHDLISDEVVAAIQEEAPGGGEGSLFQERNP